jgi:hypothetical protein
MVHCADYLAHRNPHRRDGMGWRCLACSEEVTA